MSGYIYEQADWPFFRYDSAAYSTLLAQVRYRQGRLVGYMVAFGFDISRNVGLETLVEEIEKTSEIEGEHLNSGQVLSSVARRLGLDTSGLPTPDRDVEGIVEMMLDATRNYQSPLTVDRLLDWHSALFSTGRNGMRPIRVGIWRDDRSGPMQVLSGPMGRERVHFEAPPAVRLESEIARFLEWFNRSDTMDAILKAALAHLWFVTLHPFDDGNGRIARAIADMALARADDYPWRFYSMSAQIRRERDYYYRILETTQAGSLDVTAWMQWFLGCLERAIEGSDAVVHKVIAKAQFWLQYHDTDFNNRQRLMINRLLDGFTGKLTSSKWAKIAKCSQDTAYRDILELLERGVLKKEVGGGRSTSYRLYEKAINGI